MFMLENLWVEKYRPTSCEGYVFANNIYQNKINQWIAEKNIPHADPESGLSSGNLQGFQSGVMPTTRNYGFNLKLNF